MKQVIDNYRIFMELITLTNYPTYDETRKEETLLKVFWILRKRASQVLCHYMKKHEENVEAFGKPFTAERAAHFLQALADQKTHPEHLFEKLMAKKNHSVATLPHRDLISIKVTGTIAFGLSVSGLGLSLKAWAGAQVEWSSANPLWISTGAFFGASVGIDIPVVKLKLADEGSTTNQDLTFLLELPLSVEESGAGHIIVQALTTLVQQTGVINMLLNARALATSAVGQANTRLNQFGVNGFNFTLPPRWINATKPTLAYLGKCMGTPSLDYFTGALGDMGTIATYFFQDNILGLIELVQLNPTQFEALAAAALAGAAVAGAAYGGYRALHTPAAKGKVAEAAGEGVEKLTPGFMKAITDFSPPFANIFQSVKDSFSQLVSSAAASKTKTLHLKFGYNCACGELSASWCVADGYNIDSGPLTAAWDMCQAQIFHIPQAFKHPC